MDETPHRWAWVFHQLFRRWRRAERIWLIADDSGIYRLL